MTEWTHLSESRGLVGIRNWNDNLPNAQTLNSLCTEPPPLRKNRRRGGGWCVHRLTLKWQSAQGTDTFLEDFCERQGLVRLDRKPLCWKMSPQGTGRRRKSSLRSCQYPGYTLDHTGKITTVAGRHVVNFQIASEISQSFALSCKYHSFFFFMQTEFLNVQRYSNFSILTFYPAMFSDVCFQFIWACKDSLFISTFW